MIASGNVHNSQLVEFQPEKRSAVASELIESWLPLTAPGQNTQKGG